MSRLAVIVPTRGRPENIRKVIAAWDFTGAWECADLHLAVDQDDPELQGYLQIERESRRRALYLTVQDVWTPMVPKLDAAARWAAKERDEGEYRYTAVAFAGDDHLPRTIGWARRYLDALAELGTGMVYSDDGYQGAKLSTEWAVTADAVRALGRMVPAPVDHLYCDNAMMDLYAGAGALKHLPEIRIEHMHPVAGKAASDEQYKRVNSARQYTADRGRYEIWKTPGQIGGLSEQIATIRALRAGLPDQPDPRSATSGHQQLRDAAAVRAARLERRRQERTVRGSGPRKIERSGPSRFSAPPKSRFPFPPEFRGVVGATPDEIAFTLADLAKNVPGDQEIVELGVYQARTALIMAWGAAQGNGAHVTAIDLWDSPENTYDPPFTDPATREAAFANVQNLGYADRVRLVQDNAAGQASEWAPRQKVGLLFVGDDHSYEGAKAAIEAWAPHLAEGAVIAVDDYGHPDWPGVAQAVDELVDNGFLVPIELHHDHLAVTRLTGQQNSPEPEQITAITSEGVEPEPVAEKAPAPEAEDLSETPLPELRRRVRALGIKPAGMDRDQLIKAIEDAR